MMNVMVFTSTRADFGLLQPLIQKLQQNKNSQVSLFVTGTHLDAKFGSTVSEIKKAFPDLERIEVPWSADTGIQHHQLALMASSFTLYAKTLEAKKIDLAIDLAINSAIDLAVVLGDRFETFCFASVCATLKIPIAHIHGGELTFGALDDKYRHCITKLSELHFVSTKKYHARVIQLGENPLTVFDVGAIGVENALNLKLKTIDELVVGTGLKLAKNIFMMTFHSETNTADNGTDLFKSFLKKLAVWMKSQPDSCVVVSGSNIDQGNEQIRKLIEDFGATVANQFAFVESLGMINYLSLVKHAVAVLGNSSSGVIEANSLGTPAVNIGFRQDGRETDPTVIQISNENDLNRFHFSNLLELKNQNQTWEKSIYYKPDTAGKMAAHISDYLIKNSAKATKRFHDLAGCL